MRAACGAARRPPGEEVRPIRTACFVVIVATALGCARKPPKGFDKAPLEPIVAHKTANAGPGSATKYSEGIGRVPYYDLHWQSAHVDFLDPAHFGGDMTAVVGNLYVGGKVASKFSADSAIADKASSELTLKGRVELTSTVMGSVLRCDEVAWDPDREIVRCKGNVSLDAPSYWMGNYQELWATPTHDEVATPSKFVFPAVSKFKP